ncbi:hypothetical protein HD554DRAFT_1225317 [Boletus coccyginus]|nr:hypothetical protein HD554DRAFT_1225317 [Boletus coccyginus]
MYFTSSGTSTCSSRRLSDGPVTAALLFDAASVNKVGYTVVLENTAGPGPLSDGTQSGDEFIVAEDYEGDGFFLLCLAPANNSLWKRLAQRRDAVVKYWRIVAAEEGRSSILVYLLATRRIYYTVPCFPKVRLQHLKQAISIVFCNSCIRR